MSTARVGDGLLSPYGIALLLVVFVSFAYMLLIGQLFLWITAVTTAARMIALAVFLYLFYRFVLAVEQIAADS